MRDDLDLAIDAVDDVEGTLVHLALVLGDGAIFAFGQHNAGECADRFLDDVAAGRQYRPGGIGERLAAFVAHQLERNRGGDVIKESIGAFPRVILAEGEYRAIARNEGKVFEREFKVVTGVDGDVEVLAQ